MPDANPHRDLVPASCPFCRSLVAIVAGAAVANPHYACRPAYRRRLMDASADWPRQEFDGSEPGPHLCLSIAKRLGVAL